MHNNLTLTLFCLASATPTHCSVVTQRAKSAFPLYRITVKDSIYSKNYLTFCMCGQRVRVVQLCDISRFVILCDRHHKVSPKPNP